jgi:aminoglycoside phosphotransferase (APT) family kinase protein
MNPHIDQAGTVREELPVDRLEAYLKVHLSGIEGRLVLQQFRQGYSNLTYLLRLGADEFVLRRPPFGNQVKTAHDMGREHRVLSALSVVYPAAPRPLLYCDDESVVGAPFYVMERRQGLILRNELPADCRIDPEAARRLGLTFIDNLALLHVLDYKAAGLAGLGKPEGYAARQVSGWTKRYADAWTPDVPTLEGLSRWLAENVPEDAAAALIHNDYKYDNLMLDPADLTRIVAVLDWEMATEGDPLMDLGSSLGYWAEASDPAPLRLVLGGPSSLPGSPTREELIERYQEKSGREVSKPLFYYCYGLFKIAGIAQQIYARHLRGLTRDPRFARLGEFVHVLGQQAENALSRGTI